MWRKPLNSAALTTTTHKKPKKCVRWDRYSSKGSNDQQVQDQDDPILAAFMQRRPQNSAALATTTYRKSERVSNGTGTQVQDVWNFGPMSPVQ